MARSNRHTGDYYAGVTQGMLDHMHVTESALRRLNGLQPLHIEKLVADVHKKHVKLLKRIEDQAHRYETSDA